MNFAAIDFSMTSPAITVGTSKDFSKCKTFFYTTKKTLEGKYPNNIYGFLAPPHTHEMERFDNISEWIMSIIRTFKVTDVCIEDYAFAAKGRVFHIAENTGLLKWKLWKAGVKYTSAPPTTVKKYFTGKGNAKKDMMHACFYEQTGVNIAEMFEQKEDSNPVSDIVDSYAMICYGIDNIF